MNDQAPLKRHSRGRRSKFTPETVKALLEAISCGTPVGISCDMAGISEETLSQWRQAKPEFAERLKRARACFVAANLRAIRNAGKKSWQARAWLLERCVPDQFSRSKIECRVDHGGQVGFLTTITPEQTKEYQEQRRQYEEKQAELTEALRKSDEQGDRFLAELEARKAARPA